MTGPCSPPSPLVSAVSCDLAAYALVTAPIAQIADLRRAPGPGPGQRLAPTFLKNADEQTVAALAAVCHAAHRHDLGETSFADWGVVAGPRLLGRPMMVFAIQRFLAEGAWGISPNLIPHRSLHSVSGTISQALEAHGPNFGVSGASDALYCAAGMLAGRQAPAVWVVLTALEPEPHLGENGVPAPETTCAALALALTPTGSMIPRPRLHVAGANPNNLPSAGDSPPFDLFRLADLLELALAGRVSPASLVHLLPDGGRIELACSHPERMPGPMRVAACSAVAGTAVGTIAEGST